MLSSRGDASSEYSTDAATSKSTIVGKDPCNCLETVLPREPQPVDCRCPRDEHDLVVHNEDCFNFRNETLIFPHEVTECECNPEKREVCTCCGCLPNLCLCPRAGSEALAEWRAKQTLKDMPAVLESTHPLMQKFQSTLRSFLEKENERAEVEIKALRDDLKNAKLKYDVDLETIYRSDHDTNSQRLLIEEYEATLENEIKARQEAEERARIANENYRLCKEKFDQELHQERETLQEIEALNGLVAQLEKWREETESELTVNQRMSDKMRQEKKVIGDQKRELDLIILNLTNEVWKLESKLEMYQKQIEIKNKEMDKITDKVTAYSTELEDLDLDKRRLIGLWNSVIVNIKNRDNVFDSVRDDYRNLQENYRTMMVNLDITKKANSDEMEKSKNLAMIKDKLSYDLAAVNKVYEHEEAKRLDLEARISQLNEALEMNERDQEMIKLENLTMRNILSTTQNEYNRRVAQKQKMENEILENLQECLLNDKAVEAMAAGINKMRDMSRKLEISLMQMENNHAKVALEIEMFRSHQAHNNKELEAANKMVSEKEKELETLQEDYKKKSLMMMRKQRELDTMLKKYNTLKDVFDMKSPQERRILVLEQQIKALRDRTETMQHEWLRLQGHVVKLATQHQKLLGDISLINKQIQICDQKIMHIRGSVDKVHKERYKVEQALRDLRGRLCVLERTRKDFYDRNKAIKRANLAITHEYTANLKDAEQELLELEEEIDVLDKDKVNLTQDLDHMQRQALIWQRKGILAVELKRSIKESKSAVGEIGQMKHEIHRMEVRREQLLRTAEKLSDDLALYVMRRETALERSRATAAVEQARGLSGTTSQFTYHHKLRLAKADVARVGKDLEDARSQLEQLRSEKHRLEKNVAETSAKNAQLEEHIASLLQETQAVDRSKQYMLERVVRNQRLGSELQRAVKRQSIRVKKPKASLLAEYEQACALNERLRFIMETLSKEYPYLWHKLEYVRNTLNVKTPSSTPRLTGQAACEAEPPCGPVEEVDEEQVAEKPYCSNEKCIHGQEYCNREFKKFQ